MKVARAFLYSAAALLLITASAKLVSSFGSAKILLEQEPVFKVQFQMLFRIVGGLELVVALICLCNKRAWLPAALVSWLATGFVAYRVCLWRIHWEKPCHCLGDLTDALHISPQTADNAMKFILVYLLIGGYTTLFWLWRRKRKATLLTPSPYTGLA